MTIEAYSSNLSSLTGSLFSNLGLASQVGRADGRAADSAFGQEVVRRIGIPSSTGDASAGAGAAQDTGPLAQSLARSMDFLRDQFGDETAQAAMGLVLSRTGDGEVTEDALGQGLLDVVRLIDRNFGFAAGDKVMAEFNSDVNNALNDTFDNGMSEVFFAAPAGSTVSGASSSIQTPFSSMLDQVRGQFGDDAVQSVLDVLRQSLEEQGDLRKALGQAEQSLVQQYGADPAQLGSLVPSSAQPGATLDLVV